MKRNPKLALETPNFILVVVIMKRPSTYLELVFTILVPSFTMNEFIQTPPIKRLLTHLGIVYEIMLGHMVNLFHVRFWLFISA